MVARLLDVETSCPDAPTRIFPFGGWQAPLIGEVDGAAIDEGMAGLDALLLGRKTYDIFASYWPNQEAVEGPDGAVADLFDRVPEDVASRGTPRLDWAGSSLLGPDLPAAVREVRARHENAHVIGSVSLVQTSTGPPGSTAPSSAGRSPRSTPRTVW